MTPVRATIEVDPALMRESQALFERFGLSMSQAVNLFLRQSVREQAIPFPIEQPDSGVPGKEEYFERIQRGLEQVHAGYGIVKSLNELKAIEKEIARNG